MNHSEFLSELNFIPYFLAYIEYEMHKWLLRSLNNPFSALSMPKWFVFNGIHQVRIDSLRCDVHLYVQNNLMVN